MTKVIYESRAYTKTAGNSYSKYSASDQKYHNSYNEKSNQSCKRENYVKNHKLYHKRIRGKCDSDNFGGVEIVILF